MIQPIWKHPSRSSTQIQNQLQFQNIRQEQVSDCEFTNFLFTLALKINRQPVKCRNRLMTNKRLVNSFTNECRIAFRMLIVIKKSYDREMMREFYCRCLFTLVVVLSLGYKSIWIFFFNFRWLNVCAINVMYFRME